MGGGGLLYNVVSLARVLLQETTVAEVGLDDNIADGGHDELDLGSVSCARKVGIDLLGVGQVQVDEPLEDVL